MSRPFEIPTIPAPQTFRVALAGKVYRWVLKWCSPAACWVADIYDSQGAALLRGVPLVTGVDLLGQFAYLEFLGQLYAQTDHDADAVPTFDNLGSTGHLFFVVP